MKWWLGLALIASGLAGCQVNRSPSDPFMRTTVPPPATGQAVPPPADSYYTPAPGASPAVTVTPGAPATAPTFVAPPPAAAPLSPSAAPASPPAYYNAPGAAPPGTMPPATAPPVGAPPANRYSPPGGFTVPLGSTNAPQSGSQGVQLASANVPVAADNAAAATSTTFGAPVSAKFVTPADAASQEANNGTSGNAPAQGTAAAEQTSGPASGVVTVSHNEPVTDSTAAAETTAADGVAATAASDVVDPAIVGTPLAVPAAAGGATLRIVGSATEGVVSGDNAPPGQAAPAEPATTVDGQPVRLAINQPVPEITDLPQSTGSAPPKSYGPPRSRLVFNGSPNASSPAANLVPAAAGPPGQTVAHSVQRPAGSSTNYGVAGNYETLHGRLEYSQSSRQWKLRYIPIDGQTDQFGGSVVLPNTQALTSLHPGDFVIASGHLAGDSGPKSGFSPQYDLDQIIPQ